MKWWLYLADEKKWVVINNETHERNVSYGESEKDLLVLTDDLYIASDQSSSVLSYWIEIRAKERPA